MATPGYTPPPSKERVAELKIEKQINKYKQDLNAFNGPISRLNKYGRGTPEYNQALKDKNTLDNKIGELERELALKKKSRVEEALGKAKDSGNTDEVNKIQEDLNRINAAINRDGDANIEGPMYVEGDTLGNAFREKGLIVDTDERGTSRLNSTMQGYEGQGSPHFIWSTKKGFQSKLPGFSSATKDTNVEIAYSYNDIEKKILEDATTKPGGLQALFDRLYKAQLIDKDTYVNRKLNSDFAGGLQYALNEYTLKTARDYQVLGIKEPTTFDDYLDKEFKPAGPSIKSSTQETTRDTAASDLNRFFMDYLGVGATKAQHDEYYKQLRALEQKAVKTTIETDSNVKYKGEYIDDLDRAELMRKVAGKALNGSDIDKVLKAGAGAAQAVNGVMAYAKRYGINISNKDALSYVSNELSSGQQDEKRINSKILSIAKSTYSNLTDLISEDVNLNELTSNHRLTMGTLLEIDPNSIDVMDPTIQLALKNNGNKGTMNLTEFDRLIRNDPRWAKTKNAREEASKYALEVLKDFGLMA